MVDYAQDVELLRLAARNVDQLKQLTLEIEARLRGHPEAAEEFIRPSSLLLQRLLEAQATVEALLEKLFAARRLELVGR
jgi:hypothetical protein